MKHFDERYVELLEAYEHTKTNRERQKLLQNNPEFTSEEFLHFLENLIAAGPLVSSQSSADIETKIAYTTTRLSKIRDFLETCREQGIDAVYRGLESGIATRLQQFLLAPSWIEKRPILIAELEALASDMADEILSKGIRDAQGANAKRAVRQLESHKAFLSQLRQKEPTEVMRIMDRGEVLYVDHEDQQRIKQLEELIKSASHDPEALGRANAAKKLARSSLTTRGAQRSMPPAQLHLADLCRSVFRVGGIEYIDDLVETCEIAIDEIHPNLASRCTWLAEAARSLFARYQASAREDDINEAIVYSEEALEFEIVGKIDIERGLPGFVRMRLARAHERHGIADIERAEELIRLLLKWTDSLEAHYLKGVAHLERFNLTKVPAALEDAITEYHDLLPRAEAGTSLYAFLRIDLANAYASKFSLDNDADNLKVAIDYARLALPHAGSMVSEMESRLARYLLAHYPHSGEIRELDEAIELFQRRERGGEVEPELRRPKLDRLASALWLRYHHRGYFQDLEDAIRLFKEAADLPKVRAFTPESALNNLGSALLDLSRATGSKSALERAVKLHRKSVRMTKANSSERAAHLNNLGLTLLWEVQTNPASKLLPKAVSTLRKAFKLTPPGSHDYFNHAAALAGGLMTQYEASHSQESLDETIGILRNVVTASSANARLLHMANLAVALKKRSELPGGNGCLNEAIVHFRASLTGWSSGSPGAAHAIRMSDSWGSWALDRGEFAEAGEAYRYGIAVLKDLVRVQSLRRHKEVVARVPAGFTARAAYAFARCGDLDEAAQSLESGRTFLFNEGLNLAMHEVEQLRETPAHQQLYRDLDDSAQILAALQSEGISPQTETSSPFVLQAKTLSRFETLVERVRAIDGFEKFLQPYGVPEIASAASAYPLIYLAAAKGEAIAIVAERDRPLRPIWLPSWDADGRLVAASREHTDAHQQRSVNPARWMAAQRELSLRLWDAFIGPLLPEIRNYSRVVLIPTGFISLLPLHAAATADNSRPSGYLYALDELVFSYAPNARSIMVGRSVAQRVHSPRVLAVDHPNSKGALPLWYSAYETAAAVRAVPQSERLILPGREATTESVLTAMHLYPVQHFSCHGRSLYRDPLNSHLLLAGEDKLALKQILEQRLRNVRLAVLSACESAVPGQASIDEAISLPSGFLQAGVAGVVASMWDVDQLSTMELMVRFYGALDGGSSVPAALRFAQQLVRDTTVKDKIQYLSASLIDWANPWVTRERDEKPFAHVAYWGAFAHFGRS